MADDQRRAFPKNLYGGTAPHVDSETSKAAAQLGMKAALATRQRVLDFITERGADGATDEEMQLILKMNPNTQRPRRRELVLLELVFDSGNRRKTSTGAWSNIWVTANYASSEVKQFKLKDDYYMVLDWWRQQPEGATEKEATAGCGKSRHFVHRAKKAMALQGKLVKAGKIRVEDDGGGHWEQRWKVAEEGK